MAVDEGVALRCASSDGATAIGFCDGCGDPVCGACVARRDGTALTCRRCAYKGVLGQVAIDERRRHASAAEVAAQSKEEPGRTRTVTGWVVLGVVVVALCAWSVPTLLWTFKEPAPYAVGNGGGDAPGLEECVQGLWQVREAMNTYVTGSGGVAPDRLSLLVGAPEACPGCGGAWRYRRAASGYEVACPKPGEHKRAAVFLDHATGPPQIVENRGRSR